MWKLNGSYFLESKWEKMLLAKDGGHVDARSHYSWGLIPILVSLKMAEYWLNVSYISKENMHLQTTFSSNLTNQDTAQYSSILAIFFSGAVFCNIMSLKSIFEAGYRYKLSVSVVRLTYRFVRHWPVVTQGWTVPCIFIYTFKPCKPQNSL